MFKNRTSVMLGCPYIFDNRKKKVTCQKRNFTQSAPMIRTQKTAVYFVISIIDPQII